jgi:predicted nuclease of predicted toxin-antitoxin system
MSVPLYMDEHVKSAVARALRARGVDVVTIQEDGLLGSADTVVLDRALALGRSIFTQDLDFLAEAHRRQLIGEPFAGVIYSRQLRISIGKCIADLELISKAMNLQDMLNHVEFIPY